MECEAVGWTQKAITALLLANSAFLMRSTPIFPCAKLHKSCGYIKPKATVGKTEDKLNLMFS